MRRILRYSAYALGALLALVLAAALILPSVLDRPKMAAEIKAKLSSAVGGEVQWQAFSIGLLLRPHGTLRGLRVETAAATFTAEEVTVTLRLLPLFTGSAEITSLKLSRPLLRLTVVPAAAVPQEARVEPAQNPLQAYRSVMVALADALREFAPDTVVTIEEAGVTVTVEGLPPLELSQLALSARTDAQGVEVKAAAASRYWNAMRLDGRIEYASLGSSGELHLTRVQGQAWLDWLLRSSGLHAEVPEVDLSARFRGDPAKALELELDGKAPSVTVTRDAQRLAATPVVLKGKVLADAREVALQLENLGLGGSSLAGGAVRYVLKDNALEGDVGYSLDLAQALGYARQFAPDPLEPVEAVNGALSGRAKLTLRGGEWRASATVDKPDAAVQVKDLPGPVRLESAALDVDAKTVNVQRVRVALLDSFVNASARASDFARGPRIEGAVGEATLGPQLVAWLWKRAELPPGLELKAPVALAAKRFTWGPKSQLDLQASARFDAGPALAVELGWSPGVLDVRRASIKDARSATTLSLRMKGGAYSGTYSGKLDSRTFAAMLKSAAAPAGAVSGNLAFTFDPAQPRRTWAEGTLKGEGVDLSWLAGQPAKLERIDLAADSGTLRIADAAFDWAGQHASVRGTAKRGEHGPVIDAQVDSPGVVVDALLPKAEKTAEKPTGGSAGIWPLPVTGRVAVRSKFVQYDRYKVERLAAVLALQPEHARLEVNEAFLCGLALPLTLDATPKGLAAGLQVAAQKQRLEETAQCLAGENLAITGAIDLRADLRAEGQPAELLQSLQGSVSADLRNGTVRKFALLGNILSMQNVVALVKDGGPKLEAEGFPFRQLTAKGRFEKGTFVLDEGVFHSNAVGLGANGSISLTDYQTKLTVLVAPLALVDEAVRKLPLLGYVVGGTFTSLPVSVTGDIRDPTVVPLGPRAITSELTGLVTRTFSLPGKVVPGEAKR